MGSLNWSFGDPQTLLFQESKPFFLEGPSCFLGISKKSSSSVCCHAGHLHSIYWFGGQHQYTLENERLEPHILEVGKTMFLAQLGDLFLGSMLIIRGVLSSSVYTFVCCHARIANHTSIILATALPHPKTLVVILQVVSLWMVNFCEGETWTKPNQIAQLIDEGPTKSFCKENTVWFFDTRRKP